MYIFLEVCYISVSSPLRRRLVLVLLHEVEDRTGWPVASDMGARFDARLKRLFRDLPLASNVLFDALLEPFAKGTVDVLPQIYEVGIAVKDIEAVILPGHVVLLDRGTAHNGYSPIFVVEDLLVPLPGVVFVPALFKGGLLHQEGELGLAKDGMQPQGKVRKGGKFGNSPSIAFETQPYSRHHKCTV